MVNPVTGPIVTEKVQNATNGNGVSYQTYFRRQTKYRQARPYTLVLPYLLEEIKVLSFVPESPSDMESTSWAEPYDQVIFNAAHEKAYAQLAGSIAATASIGAALGERRQAISMLSRRAKQLSEVAFHLRKRQWSSAANALRVSLTNDAKTRIQAAKTVSDFWLETWFGWKPLFSDISSAIEILQYRNPPKVSIKGKGESRSSRSYLPPRTNMGLGGFQETRIFFHQSVKVWVGGKIRVVSPNLHLANQLGFVNAGLIAWELVPWSFAVDWLLNVSQVIGSFTTFAGLEFSGAYTSSLREITESGSRVTVARYWYNDGPKSYIQQNVYARSYSKRKLEFRRTQGVSAPVIRLRLPDLPVTRLATISALIGQQIGHFGR